MNGWTWKAFAMTFMIATLGHDHNASAGITQTYLSLGDSLAFGETVFQNNPALGNYSDPSFAANRGYVGMFSTYLASKNGGVAPDVVNLAIPGESTSSFSSGVGRVPPGVGYSDAFLAHLNLNYTGATPPTQSSLLASTLASEAAAGHVISNVTISLGSNDLFGLALTDPNALADLPATLAHYRSNYESLLTGLRASLPNARIDLISSYDPFTATPTSPLAALAAYAIPLLNQQTAAVASEFHANYVDIYNSPLTTNAATFTLILNNGDVHPNFDLGYGVIDSRLQAVPEPSSAVILLLGSGGLIMWTFKRRHRQLI